MRPPAIELLARVSAKAGVRRLPFAARMAVCSDYVTATKTDTHRAQNFLSLVDRLRRPGLPVGNAQWTQSLDDPWDRR